MNTDENVELYYDLFLNEFKIAKHIVDNLLPKVTGIVDRLKNNELKIKNHIEFLNNYDVSLANISEVTDILRKFNIQMEITTFKNHDDKLIIIANNKEPVLAEFTFPPCDNSKYCINYEGEGLITFVENVKNKLFYLTDPSSPYLKSGEIGMDNFFDDSPIALKSIPDCGIVFGLFLDNFMLRVVRQNSALTSKLINVYLIDVGELLEIDIENSVLYALSEAQKCIPAQAFLCKLVKVNGESGCDLEAYLKKSLYVKHIFKVISIKNSILHVELTSMEKQTSNNIIADSISNVCDEPEVNQIFALSNPFNPFRVSPAHQSSKQIKEKLPNQNNIELVSSLNPDAKSFSVDPINEQTKQFFNNPKNFEFPSPVKTGCVDYKPNNLLLINDIERDDAKQFNYVQQKLDTQLKSPSLLKQNVNIQQPSSSKNYNITKLDNVQANKYSHNELTPEQMKILYEEPLNTENAMVAVMGYNPTDDKRICKFYDPKTKGCFKGANCRLEHVQKLEGGWTRDVALSKTTPIIQMSMPAVKSCIMMVPTHVASVGIFYAQIPQQNANNMISLKEFIYKLNSIEVKATYRHLNKIPGQFELVMALYSDGQWYRAKVLTPSDTEHIKVYFVDYGNCLTVPLNNLRQWDSRFDYYPMQAYRCRLENVEISKQSEGAMELRNMILNRPVMAKVWRNTDNVGVTLTTDDGFDIGEMLCAMNLALPRTPELVLPNPVELLPA